jgi:hexosaminidase
MSDVLKWIKRLFFIGLSVSVASFSNKVLSNEILHILPYPQEIKYHGEWFTLHSELDIRADEKLENEKTFLVPYVQSWNTVIETQREGEIVIHVYLDDTIHESEEAYRLIIRDSEIKIIGTTERGCFYGIQTLIQLVDTDAGKVRLPQLEILDYPNYCWRSYMLDEARYFFGKEFVFKLLDELAALKVNKFHWHLTDDAGWRIEIKKYPLLVEKGSLRDSSKIEDKVNGIRFGTQLYDGIPHGGFYTQKEIKEIIRYAQTLKIDIIPEIEMPGHSSAAIVAYPWLGVKGELERVPTKFGKHQDSYNIADPKVIGFLHDVLDEVCELFPYEVIHIGGDEVLFGAWNESKEIQDYLKEHNLKSAADAQIKFTNDISKYLESKGKRMMGWNEIMGYNVHDFNGVEDYQIQTSLSKNAIIHFWQGSKEMVTLAAQNGHDVVYSGAGDTYLDYYYKNVSLNKVYHMQPIPNGLDGKYIENILGVGVQMWTEWAPTYKDVEYKTFPRVAAFAESTWSGKYDYKGFLVRLKKYSKRWIKKGLQFPMEQIK